MTPTLTTITPYWNRPEMLPGWVAALKAAWVEGVTHVIFEVSEHPRRNFKPFFAEPAIFGHVWGNDNPPKSIGCYHNRMAQRAESEWIMKLDVDTVPNPQFFRALMPLLAAAKAGEWFNAGMVFVNQQMSEVLPKFGPTMPFHQLLTGPGVLLRNPLQATNFICRRADYLALGGCLPEFRGWGWEDYQQIYMLEKHQLGKDPLPGPVTLQNVTQRCRDEISKPKAQELFKLDRNLALLHRWHPPSSNPDYKNPTNTERNRKILLDYVLKERNNAPPHVQSTSRFICDFPVR